MKSMVLYIRFLGMSYIVSEASMGRYFVRLCPSL
jgi:hypothetical protein